MLISFGYTSQYLPPDGPKRVTRRDWKTRQYQAWLRSYEADPFRWHPAWNKTPGYRGAKQIGHILLTTAPHQESIYNMPQEDLVLEGGMCGTLQEFREKFFPNPNSLKAGPGIVTVVRFEFLPLAYTMVPSSQGLTVFKIVARNGFGDREEIGTFPRIPQSIGEIAKVVWEKEYD